MGFTFEPTFFHPGYTIEVCRNTSDMIRKGRSLDSLRRPIAITNQIKQRKVRSRAAGPGSEITDQKDGFEDRNNPTRY